MSFSHPIWKLISCQSVSEGCFSDQKNLVFEVGSDHDINLYILPLSGLKWYSNNSYTCLKACVGLFRASVDPQPYSGDVTNKKIFLVCTKSSISP